MGDLDGDGDLDFVSANYISNNVSVMLNNGSAAFSNATGSPIPVGTRPVAVALADFNGDHKLDIAVTSNNTNTVSILLNNGNGTFTNGGTPATGAGPRGIAAGDSSTAMAISISRPPTPVAVPSVYFATTARVGSHLRTAHPSRSEFRRAAS